MKICVCIKEVPDSDVPSNKLKIDHENLRILPSENVPSIVNGFDLNAVELALRFSENFDNATVSIISVGHNLTSDVIKKPIAMGADEIITCDEEKVKNIDVNATAHIISKLIEKTGPYDVIFSGRHASDFDMATVPFALSEILSIPIVNIVRNIKCEDDNLILERVITDGYQVIEAKLPIIITAGNQVGDPRYPTLKGIMGASKKEIKNFTLEDLGISKDEIYSKVNLEELYFPVNKNKVEIINGKDNKEKASILISKLREEGII